MVVGVSRFSLLFSTCSQFIFCNLSACMCLPVCACVSIFLWNIVVLSQSKTTFSKFIFYFWCAPAVAALVSRKHSFHLSSIRTSLLLYSRVFLFGFAFLYFLALFVWRNKGKKERKDATFSFLFCLFFVGVLFVCLFAMALFSSMFYPVAFFFFLFHSFFHSVCLIVAIRNAPLEP